MKYNLICGNSLEELKKLADNSVDSIVTDPPYELGFMGKAWDSTGIAYNKDLWKECLRVLKPGGHLLAFSGTRTYHRMTVAIEDAGFEIRDQIQWLYGSGFPKSSDISKTIDKLDAKDERLNRNLRFTEWMRSTGLNSSQIDKITNTNMGGHYITKASQPAVPTRELFNLLKPHIKTNIPEWVEDLVNKRTVESQNFKNREVVGFQKRGNSVNTDFMSGGNNITKPSTPEAQKWQGWGTALKPANEPICVARKPFKTTVAENVLKYGVGAMNIEESKIENENEDKSWPANVIHDGLQEEWSRYFYCAKASKKDRNEGLDGFELKVAGGMQGRQDGSMGSITYNQNYHPTVKPTDLMAYLVRLVTPPGGTVLDPFNGSGSTGKACARLGFNYIGIDLSQEYLDISKARIENELNNLTK